MYSASSCLTVTDAQKGCRHYLLVGHLDIDLQAKHKMNFVFGGKQMDRSVLYSGRCSRSRR